MKNHRRLYFRKHVILVELTEFFVLNFYENQSHDAYSLGSTNDNEFCFI